MSNQDETLAGDDDGERASDNDQELPESPPGQNSETVMQEGSEQPSKASQKPEDTVQLPADQQGHVAADTADRTFVPLEDQTVVEDTSFGDPATIVDLPASELAATTDEDDHTVVEDGADNADGTVIESAPHDEDATYIAELSTDNANFDGTVIEGATAEAADPDGTIIEGTLDGTTDADDTIVQDATGDASFSQTGATDFEGASKSGASSKGDWNETRNSSREKRPTKGKAAHETANRWDAEQRYQLVTNFARGGLGQIWMANDSRLRREVAFKELLPSALKNRNALERFLEEAQITGQLEHPGIVPIYDIGYQENGTPFYAMKLVRGETMEKEIEAFHQLPKHSPEWTLTFRRLLANFIDICNALAFAHDRGVLHRDLKPLNVMVGAFGETLVLDWGLAKVMDVDPIGDEAPISTSTSDFDIDSQTVMESQTADLQTGTAVAEPSTGGASNAATSAAGQSQFSGSFGSTRKMVYTDVRSAGSQTMMGSVMGTPAYMPPEQAAGKLDELDARTDIYSLGGILYKLLTNHQPIARGKLREVLRNVKQGNIVPPRDYDASIGKPIEAICMKAMAMDREDRYDSALTIAADIEAWLADEPVSCYQDPWLTKTKRWAKRNRSTVNSVAAAAVVLFVVWVGSAWAHRNAMDAIRNVARNKTQLSATAADQGDYVQARELLNEALGRTGEYTELNELRSFLTSRLQLVETDRLAKLGRDAEAKLVKSRSQILDGNYESARTLLAELATLLKDETTLSDITAEVTRQTKTVTDALAQQEAVTDTQARFDEFLAELDQARIRSSLPDAEDISEDVQLAISHVNNALATFDLDRLEPFVETPQHFSERLPWTRKWQRDNGQWPLQTLREGTFELLLVRADMEWWVARHESDEAKSEAAERALVWTAKATSMEIPSKTLLVRKANYLRQAGRADEAQRTFVEANSAKPETSLDFYLLGQESRGARNFHEALDYLLKAQQMSPDHYWVQYYQGLCYLNLREYAAAASSFSSCVARRPDYPWAYIQRSICSAQLGQFENAAADFDSAEQLDPTLFSIFVNRGVVLLTQGRYEEALENLEKARELNPNSGKPLVNIAAAYLALAAELERPSSADDSENEKNTEPASDLEIRQQVLELYDKALEALTEAANSGAGNHPGLHQLRGRIFAWQSKNEAALISYRRHLELDEDNDRKAATLKRIAGIHSQLGEHDKAVEHLEASYMLRPSDPDTVLLLAESQLQLDEDQKAVDRYTEFLKMVNGEIEKTVPSPHIVYNGIATAFDRMKMKFEAVDYYTLSLMFERRQAVPLTKRAWAFLEDGVNLAIRDFETAKKLSPENPDTLIGLASAYAKNGQRDDAIREVDMACPFARAQAVEVGPEAFALFHNAATVHGRLGASALLNPRLTAELRSQQFTESATRAVDLLREAFDIARSDATKAREMLAAMQTDEALRSIRGSKAYGKFIEELSKELSGGTSK